ncbi:MAG: hypothetical protein VKJ06_05380 [Vampirovibrionales bacterium]|nr:hypothetical protein [Vampirovibrionales bacterium]
MPTETNTVTTAPTPVIYKFGTSGYRNDTDAGFNEAVVRQITGAIADYFIDQLQRLGLGDCAATMLVGGDTREKTIKFAPLVANLLLERGFDVALAEDDIPTPVLAFAASHLDKLGLMHAHSVGAVLLSASHNPWPYGGYNFLTNQGAVAPSAMTQAFEALQANPKALKLNRKGQLKPLEAYMAYRRHLIEQVQINFPSITHAGLQVFYSPLYATGRRYLPPLLADEGVQIHMLQGDADRPQGYTGMPNPVAEELEPLIHAVKGASPAAGSIVGLANDGDADRFGVIDENGQFVHANDVLLLVLWHQLNHRLVDRPLTGTVLRSQATSHKLDALLKQIPQTAIEVIQTPVGYKYIAECFIEQEEQGLPEIILGGESSGGLSIGGHIPEKDGILANLLVLEAMAKAKIPLSRLISEINASLPQRYAFHEIAVRTPDGAKILDQAQAFITTALPVDTQSSVAEAEKLQTKFGTRDGLKFYLSNGGWVLLRASGTEPLLRVYSEGTGASSPEAEATCQAQLKTIQDWLTNNFKINAIGTH